MSAKMVEMSYNGSSPHLPKKLLVEKAADADTKIVQKDIQTYPQPTSDPLDPLNWNRWRKLVILGIVMWMYFLFTYITTTTVPSFPQIQEQFNISYSQVNWTVAIPALGLAIGPLFWSSLADIYGRRIIFIIGTVIALISTIGVAFASSSGGYMAARFFQGFGVSPAATVGLAIINDLFFEDERGQKIGLWVLAIDMGLLVGPLIGGFMDLVSARWINGLTAIFFGVLLAMELVFLPETLYPRNYMLGHMPATMAGSANSDVEKPVRHSVNAADVDLRRTRKLGFINLKPVPGMRHPKPWDSILRFLLMFKYLAVSVAVFAYCFTWYWWILSIITSIPAAYAKYSPQIQGLLFLGLILGTLLSEIFCSGRLTDFIVAKLAKRNNNTRVAEMRLWLAYPAALISSIGLIIWGISIDKSYHWMVGQVAFFLCKSSTQSRSRRLRADSSKVAAGMQIGNTVISSYIVDCYPLQSMSVITFYAVFLNLSAFINPFFITPWVDQSGYTWSFAAQGIITFFAFVPVIACLHRFGPIVRAKNGQPGWVNPEYDVM
ncbi:MAG: hypothetical protein M1816_001250 [Peltula sp. TS41687]|nr:MAG: hypothetical protein M1816_001250 [Peltula sp. TS41687]